VRGDEGRRCKKCYFAPQPKKVGMQTAPRLRYSLVGLRALPYLAFGRVLVFINNSPSSHSVVSCRWMDVPPTTRRTAVRCSLNPKHEVIPVQRFVTRSVMQSITRWFKKNRALRLLYRGGVTSSTHCLPSLVKRYSTTAVGAPMNVACCGVHLYNRAYRSPPPRKPPHANALLSRISPHS
jgi:hypothetical protein